MVVRGLSDGGAVPPCRERDNHQVYVPIPATYDV
jgi:hypothetical protein